LNTQAETKPTCPGKNEEIHIYNSTTQQDLPRKYPIRHDRVKIITKIPIASKAEAAVISTPTNSAVVSKREIPIASFSTYAHA
jgi:hypothetical protein